MVKIIKYKLSFILLASVLVLGLVEISVAQSFKLLCNGKTIPVMEQNDALLSCGLNTYKYARATYTGNPLFMEITVTGFEFDNSDWDISPHSYGIKGAKKGNQLTFTINHTGYVVIRFKKIQDFTKRLVIFIEPPEELPDGDLVDVVKTYKINNTGEKNETAKIQQALNEISASGKVLYFPDGIYKTYSLQIKSNSRIHLSKNARITVEDCSFEQKFPRKIQITRVESHTKVDDLQVTFKNLTIENTKIKSLDSNYFNLSKCNGVIQFE